MLLLLTPPVERVPISQLTIPQIGVVKSGDSLVIDDFEEFKLVEDFAFFVLRPLARESTDFADQLPVQVPVHHFPDDASRAPGLGGDRKGD